MNVCSMKSLLSDSFAGEWGSESGEALTPVLRTANFNDDGSLDYGSPAYRCIPEKKVRAKRMRRGDIILEKSGGTPNRPVGIMAYYDSDDEALCSNFNHVLRFDADSVNPFFMFHQLRWLREKGAFSPYTRKTTGLQNLQMKAFVDLELKVPAKAKQDGAAATIRAIDLRRNELKKLLEKLDELVKSRFVEMFGDPIENPFGWEVAPLGQLGDLKNGVNFKSVDSGTEIRCLGVGDFKDRYQICDMELISLVSLNGRPNENQLLRDGDIVFVRSNGNKQLVGRCLAVFPGNEEVTFSGFCIRFRNESDRLLLDYLLGCLKSDPMRKAMTGRGANIQNLSQKILADVVMPIPPLALQQEFAAFVQQVDKLKFETQQAIDKLQMLYDSLAQEYFGSE